MYSIITTTNGCAIMHSKPERNIKPKSPIFWAWVPAMKLVEERWRTAATTNSQNSWVLAPAVPFHQRPLGDLFQTILPIQTAVNAKPWQPHHPPESCCCFLVLFPFWRYSLLTTEIRRNFSVLPRQARGKLLDQIHLLKVRHPKLRCICTKSICWSQWILFHPTSS